MLSTCFLASASSYHEVGSRGAGGSIFFSNSWRYLQVSQCLVRIDFLLMPSLSERHDLPAPTKYLFIFHWCHWVQAWSKGASSMELVLNYCHEIPDVHHVVWAAASSLRAASGQRHCSTSAEQGPLEPINQFSLARNHSSELEWAWFPSPYLRLYRCIKDWTLINCWLVFW